MPWYNDLRPDSDNKKQQFGLVFPDFPKAAKVRCIEKLLHLRQYLESRVPPKSTNKNILIASWNIKEFGQLRERLPESYFYIAEIINCFDLVAIQEVKNSLEDLFILMRLLGSDWDYVINDITEGTKGNSERFAYLFDKRRVEFSGLAGEIVLWDQISLNHPISQLMRTPFITGFKAGWKSFAIINVHLNPRNTEVDQQIRKSEIELLIQVIEEKIRKKSLWTENLMIMGDFNIYSDNEDMVDLLLDKGFRELENLKGQPTNVSGTEAYDKIFFNKNKYFNLASDLDNEAGGVLKFFESVYPSSEFHFYRGEMLAHKDDPSTLTSDDKFNTYFDRYWKRNQMSDHYPVWIDMQIDSSDAFLGEKKQKLENELEG